MDYKNLRKAIRKTLKENFEDLGIWSDFDSKEMMNAAQQAAKEDIESSGEKFVPLGKSKFEKDLNVEDMIADLEAQKFLNSGKSLQRIQNQIDQLKRFGAGSVNETGVRINKHEDSKIERPKDSKGQPITLNARVKDNETGSVGRIKRLGSDDNGKLTVHIDWIGSDLGQEVPSTIKYPTDIAIDDVNRNVREGEGMSLPIQKGMNVKEGSGIGLNVKNGMNAKPFIKK